MHSIVWFLAGIVVAASACIIIFFIRRRQETALADRLLAELQQQKSAELATLVDQLKTSFAALSRDALSENTDQFLKVAQSKFGDQTVRHDQTLDEKKKLIDARLEEMTNKLTALNTLMQSVDKGRAESSAAINTRLDNAAKLIGTLDQTASKLREALANPQHRGQWGERMAEDVLRLAGLIEGINYRRQTSVSSGDRPDFTFLLPGDRIVHMDVKFPAANYLKMLEAPDETIRAASTSQFLKDVRNRIKDVSKRTYVDAAEGTVDYLLVFIPNEQIYSFIHEHDRTLMDDALKSKVVLCSPLTLYAILAVIRQGTENFRLERTSAEIVRLMGEFKKQWEKYVETMDKMGSKLQDAIKTYEELTTTRTRGLDRQLQRIEDLQVSETKELPVGTTLNTRPETPEHFRTTLG